jgi:hypothetical protein
MNVIKNTILKGDDELSEVRDLVIDSFFAGLMLFGFIQSINDHRLFFTILFAVLFIIDIVKAKYEYKQIKDYLNN